MTKTKFSIIAVASMVGVVNEPASGLPQFEPDDAEKYRNSVKNLRTLPAFWGFAHLGLDAPGGQEIWTVRITKRDNFRFGPEDLSCRFIQHYGVIPDVLRGFPSSIITVEQENLHRFLGVCERSGIETEVHIYNGEVNITPPLEKRNAA